MRTTRFLLVLAAVATLAACSENASLVDPDSATAMRDGTGYFGTGNKDGQTSAGDTTTVTQRGVGYLGTGN
ncbi:MAG: hypothetical protein AB1941_11850 [Gemmatimonadota bacterium]